MICHIMLEHTYFRSEMVNFRCQHYILFFCGVCALNFFIFFSTELHSLCTPTHHYVRLPFDHYRIITRTLNTWYVFGILDSFNNFSDCLNMHCLLNTTVFSLSCIMSCTQSLNSSWINVATIQMIKIYFILFPRL